MKLISCYIENFGGLHQYSVEFEEGITVIEAPNGFGKTTLAEFIRAMFYGFPRAAKELQKNPRLKYLPWQGGKYGGWLLFEHQGHRYRMERSFGERPAQDKFKLIDEDTGRESAAFTANIGVELFGIDAESFQRSTYLPQSHDNGPLTTDSLRARLGNLLEDTGDMAGFEKALTRIQERRKTYELYRGTGGSIPAVRRQISQLQQTILTTRNSATLLEQTEADIARTEPEQTEANKALEQVREEISAGAQLQTDAALSRQYEGILTRRDTCRSRQQAVMEKYPEGLPTAQQLTQAAALLDSRKLLENSLTETSADRAAADTAARLALKFSHGTPTDEDFSHGEALYKESLTLQSKHAAAVMQVNDPVCLDKLSTLSALGVPEESWLHKQEQNLFRAKDMELSAEGLRAELPPAPVQPGKLHGAFLPVMLLSILCFALGGAVAAMAAQMFAIFASPALQPVMDYVSANPALVSGVTLGAGVLLLVIAVALQARRGAQCKAAAAAAEARAQQEVKIDALTAEAAELTKQLLDAMAPYNLQEPAERALQTLRTRREQYSALQDSRGHYNRIARQLDDALTLTQRKMDDLLRPYGATAAIETFHTQLSSLRRDRDSYLSACEQLQRRREALEQRDARLDAVNKELTAFAAVFALSAVETSHVDTMREDLATLKRLQQLQTDIEAELNSFCAQYGPRPAGQLPDTLPDMDVLKARELQTIRRCNDIGDTLLQYKRKARQLRDELDKLPGLEDELQRLTVQLAADTHNRDLLDTTEAMLKQARESLSNRYLGGVQGHFARYLNRLTGESAAAVRMNSDLEVQLERSGEARPLGYFSAGQSDMVGLCMRLALADALFEAESAFMILDDPFVNLDDEHAARALELLRELAADRQFVYLVCHSSRRI